MKKKLYMILFAVVLCFQTALALQAEGGFADAYYRVLDMAELLTEEEEAALIEALDEISLRQKMDVVVATTDDLEGYYIRDYADQLYEKCLFGYGESADGLMLLISTEDNSWHICTCGYGITAFTEAGIQYIGEQIGTSMSKGNFAAAFSDFAALADDFITQARTGKPYDTGNLPRSPLSPLWIPVSLVIGFVLAKIMVGKMKGKLKSVRAQTAANSYVKSGSMNITESRELFLYNTVTKAAKTTTSSGNGTHTSSSGKTFGGGGGKF